MRAGTDPLNWLSDKDKVSNVSFAQATKSSAICPERLFPSNFNACKLHKLLTRIMESHLEDDSMREFFKRNHVPNCIWNGALQLIEREIKM